MKHLLLICCILFSCFARAQKEKETFYLFDKDWKGVKNIGSAEFLMHVVPEADTLFVCRVYNKNGPMVRQESYKDKELEIPHGRFIWYNADGKIDSTGMVNTRKKDGDWEYYNDTMGVFLTVKYNNGKELWRKDFRRKKIITKEGETDMAEEKKDTGRVDERRAEFKGGPAGYKHWLEKNLQTPERTASLGRDGEVRFRFVVNKEGSVENVMILKSLEWAADKEVLRVMSIVPKWEPAFQNGKNVIYQCMQVINFSMN